MDSAFYGIHFWNRLWELSFLSFVLVAFMGVIMHTLPLCRHSLGYLRFERPKEAPDLLEPFLSLNCFLHFSFGSASGS